MNTVKEDKFSISLLIFIISLTPVNAVLYTPALPQLTAFLNISKAQAQHTIAFFLIGYALSQIVFGVLANYYGHRKALLIGLNIGFAASFLSIIACLIKNYEILLYSRFLVGFGTAASLIITYAIVNDTYSGVKAKKVMTYIVMSFAIAPGIANFAGGFLTKINPIFCFYFLFLYNLIALIIVKKMKKNNVNPKVRNDFNFISFFREYLSAFVDRKIILPALIYGLFVAILYSIISILPFVVIQTLHYSPQVFGILFCLSYIGYLLGSITLSYFSHKLNYFQGIYVGIFIAAIAEVTLVVLTMLNLVNVYIIFICIFFILFSMPLIFVNASLLGVSKHKNKSTASSVLNFINVGTACIAVFICGFVKENFLLNLSFILLILSIIAFVLLTFVFVKRVYTISSIKNQVRFQEIKQH